MNGYRLLLVSAVGERDGMALELAAEPGSAGWVGVGGGS